MEGLGGGRATDKEGLEDAQRRRSIGNSKNQRKTYTVAGAGKRTVSDQPGFDRRRHEPLKLILEVQREPGFTVSGLVAAAS